MKNNKILLIVGLIIVALILYNSSEIFSISNTKFKLVDSKINLKPGDCYDEKTIINISTYSKTKNRIYYEDGCACTYLFQSGGKDMTINVPISSDYMSYSQMKSYATFIKDTFKSSFSPAKDYNYVFYVEKKSGDCLKPNSNLQYFCSPKIVVRTSYDVDTGMGITTGFGQMVILKIAEKTKSVVLHELGHTFGLSDEQYIKYGQNYPVRLVPEETARINQVAGYFKKIYVNSFICMSTDSIYKEQLRTCYGLAWQSEYGINDRYIDLTCTKERCIKTKGIWSEPTKCICKNKWNNGCT